jgi:hypothetical protein
VISAAAKIMMHIKTEVQLHRNLCREYGVSDEEMEHGQEDLACVAYTRWVTDVGTREDWYGLQIAMMPCLLGYGAIARRLYDDEQTVRGISSRKELTKMGINILDGLRTMSLMTLLKLSGSDKIYWKPMPLS